MLWAWKQLGTKDSKSSRLKTDVMTHTCNPNPSPSRRQRQETENSLTSLRKRRNPADPAAKQNETIANTQVPNYLSVCSVCLRVLLCMYVYIWPKHTLGSMRCLSGQRYLLCMVVWILMAPLGLYFECSVPSWWNYLGKMRRCGLVGSVPLGVSFEISRACTRLSAPFSACHPWTGL